MIPEARSILVRALRRQRKLLEQLERDAHLAQMVLEAAQACAQALRDGGRILIAGNGGSAAQAQHLAAELVGRFATERDAFDAIALSADSAVLSALSNDLGFEQAFARQVRAYGRAGDVLVAMSTSGRSRNLLEALRVARQRGLHCVGMTGTGGGELGELCDWLIAVPSDEIAGIQEAHLLLAHVLCEIIEREGGRAPPGN